MLGNSRQKLCALPIGKRQQGCMRRTDDKIQIAVPQSCVSFGDGKQQADAGVETFRFKEAKLDGSDGRKIRIRDKIGNGDPYHSFSGPGRGALRQLCVLNDLNRWNELNWSEPHSLDSWAAEVRSEERRVGKECRWWGWVRN